MNTLNVIMFFILCGLIYPSWLQHHARGWKFMAFWAAPMIGFAFGWWAR